MFKEFLPGHPMGKRIQRHAFSPDCLMALLVAAARCSG